MSEKDRRQRAVADLIRQQQLTSQEEVADRLVALGFPVTQATVSRDLEQLGAVKVRRGGQLRYALPEEQRETHAPRLASIFQDWVRTIEPAGNLVVIKSPPGSAHLVGVALDNAGLAEIVGTICGDDTIFVACRSSSDAEILAGKMKSSSLDLQ
jgi:transcriptional regulator of arginine metabolism